MDFNYLEAFNDFNPLADEIPNELEKVAHIVQRSKWLLNNRSINELNLALELLHLIKIKSTAGIFSLIEKHEGKISSDGMLHTTEPQQIFAHHGEIELSDIVQLPGITWPELFAIYALGRIGLTISIHKYHQQLIKEGKTVMLPFQKQWDEYPITAMESLAYGETLQLMEELKREPNQKRAQAMKKIKLEQYLPIKLEMAKQVNLQESKISDRKLAKQIVNNLSEELKLTLLNEDPQQQLAIWIGQYRKGTIAGLDHLPPYKLH